MMNVIMFVNTKDPNKDPTRINEKLREILDFTRSSYMVHSEHLANVFIDPDMPKELKEDLFLETLLIISNHLVIIVVAKNIWKNK